MQYKTTFITFYSFACILHTYCMQEPISKQLIKKYMVPEHNTWHHMERLTKQKPSQLLAKDSRFIKLKTSFERTKKEQTFQELQLIKDTAQEIAQNIQVKQHAMYNDFYYHEDMLDEFKNGTILLGIAAIYKGFSLSTTTGLFFLSLLKTAYHSIKYKQYQRCHTINKNLLQEMLSIKSTIEAIQQNSHEN